MQQCEDPQSKNDSDIYVEKGVLHYIGYVLCKSQTQTMHIAGMKVYFVIVFQYTTAFK